MQRRVFAAINIAGKEKNYIDKKISGIKEKIPARWINKDNYHITLSFWGNIDDDSIQELISALKNSIADIEVFDLHLNKIILAPSTETPKMLWLQGEKNEELIKLRGEIEKNISKVNNENNEFKPHINIARLKGYGAKESALKNTEAISEVKVDLLVPVFSVEIMESVAEKGELKYYKIESIELEK